VGQRRGRLGARAAAAGARAAAAGASMPGRRQGASMPAITSAAGSKHAGNHVGGREQPCANFDFEEKTHNLPLLSMI
jgi:hypothetical protein